MNGQKTRYKEGDKVIFRTNSNRSYDTWPELNDLDNEKVIITRVNYHNNGIDGYNIRETDLLVYEDELFPASEIMFKKE